MSETCLVIVDMQNGFVTPECRRIIPNVNRLHEAATRQGWCVLFTKFVNRENSGFMKWIGWRRLTGPPETDLIAEFADYESIAVHKSKYSVFNEEVIQMCRERGIERVVLCGVATEGCVLKTAVDAFERGIEPVVVYDACYSHAGEEVHQAGLLLLGRFIGKGQLRTTEALISEYTDEKSG